MTIHSSNTLLRIVTDFLNHTLLSVYINLNFFHHCRIVIVSDIFHYQGRLFWRDLNFEKKNNKYNRIRAYTQSKMANIMHARELANRLEGSGIKVVSLHPGKRIVQERLWSF